MTAATVFMARGGFYVGYSCNGEETDLAGPFDDDIDAVDAARRADTDELAVNLDVVRGHWGSNTIADDTQRSER